MNVYKMAKYCSFTLLVFKWGIGKRGSPTLEVKALGKGIKEACAPPVLVNVQIRAIRILCLETKL